MTDLETVEVASDEIAENDAVETQEQDDVESHEATEPDGDTQDGESQEEFPKKAVNALNRKNKQITKLRAQMRELQTKLNESAKPLESKPVNEADYESYADYINAQVEALVDQKTKQSQGDMQKQQLLQQQEALKAQRDNHIIEQAQEVARTLPDLPQVWQQNAQLLDALPEQVADIFYDLDNAPAAVYVLAKEGKLESLLYANPAVAAYEIINAQNRGMALLAKPQTRTTQAPQPISKARGTGSYKKQLSPNDDVLKSLGFKS
jgi:hypothetical protein